MMGDEDDDDGWDEIVGGADGGIMESGPFKGKRIVFCDDTEVRAEQAGIDAIVEAFGIAGGFFSDGTEFWMLTDEDDRDDKCANALPIPVKPEWTLLQGLAEIRKVIPGWPMREVKQ